MAGYNDGSNNYGGYDGYDGYGYEEFIGKRYTPPDEQTVNGRGDGPQDNLTYEQRKELEAAKAQHRETTEATRRAAAVANETVDIGKNTLIELHRQGEQLDQIDISMKAMEEDVEEADSIVKYMRNCFCVTFFACCGNMDPNHKRDATRAKRMAARAAKIDEERAAVAEKHLAAAAAVDRRIQPSQQQVNIPENIPRPGPNATREEWDEYEQEMARAELMSGGGQRQAREPGTSNAWHGLSDQDASELQHETDIQDAHLDIISHALDNMKMIGQDINTELGNQDETLDRLPVRAEKLAMRLDHINKEAQKL